MVKFSRSWEIQTRATRDIFHYEIPIHSAMLSRQCLKHIHFNSSIDSASSKSIASGEQRSIGIEIRGRTLLSLAVLRLGIPRRIVLASTKSIELFTCRRTIKIFPLRIARLSRFRSVMSHRWLIKSRRADLEFSYLSAQRACFYRSPFPR